MDLEKEILTLLQKNGAMYESEIQVLFCATEDIKQMKPIMNQLIKLISKKKINLEFDKTGNRIYNCLTRTLN